MTELSLFSWNVNGIRAVLNKGNLQELINKYQPDILCLQETKAHKNQVEIDFPDYQEYWNSAEKAGYSGTAIFSKMTPLSIKNGFSDEINQKYQLSDSYGDLRKEGRVISAEFNDFWVITVYTPNSKGDLSRLDLRTKWDLAFLDHINNLKKTKPVFFCGDLNVAHNEIDLANPAQNKGKHGFTTEERQGFDNFEKNNFIDIFRAENTQKTDAFTWWTHWANSRARNVGWRIDYWLASKNAMKFVKKAEIYPKIMGSDHCPISLRISL